MLNTAPTARYASVSKQKSDGATYTPKILAEFVAKQMLDAFEIPNKGPIRILDPACGDGALLEALISKLPPSTRKRLVIVGFDTDPAAIALATRRLRDIYSDLDLQLNEGNFLEYVLNLKVEVDLLTANKVFEPFHLVIANPPYVRTQVLGAEHAQKLGISFNLSGRVDLYYPFILGISEVLDERGVSGVITSNRFMTTKSGQDVRREMLIRFDLLGIWDLGDTKLFDAAVLPSVFVAKRSRNNLSTAVDTIKFSTIYATKEKPSSKSENALEALNEASNNIAETPDGRYFRVQHGTLSNGDIPEGVWRISTNESEQWLATVAANTWDTFRRIGRIRVGVKSTADKIFLRSDWDELPGGRPELLKPLITKRCSRRFRGVVPDNLKHRKEILYPHKATKTGRSAVDLSLYPISAKYLEEHREALESRKYLIDSGRNWYELWVPQDPAAWQLPKLVFRDISVQPVFWIDTDGGVVNGECYWLQCMNNSEQNLLWLALAVANSTFIEAFYDHRFNNKLYAGRRRFITQYVELFPLPNPNTAEAEAIVKLVKTIHAKTPSTEADKLYSELDSRVWKIFGLEFKETSR